MCAVCPESVVCFLSSILVLGGPRCWFGSQNLWNLSSLRWGEFTFKRNCWLSCPWACLAVTTVESVHFLGSSPHMWLVAWVWMRPLCVRCGQWVSLNFRQNHLFWSRTYLWSRKLPLSAKTVLKPVIISHSVCSGALFYWKRFDLRSLCSS